MLEASRRSFIVALVAAPAIVRAGRAGQVGDAEVLGKMKQLLTIAIAIAVALALVVETFVIAGPFLMRDRPVDCSLPQNCLVGKALFYGTWRRTEQ